MGLVQTWRKKPIEVHAMRVLDEDDITAAEEWVDRYDGSYLTIRYPGQPTAFKIRTLEGDMEWKPGSWLIKGVHDEFYFCDDVIFRKTYDFSEVDE